MAIQAQMYPDSFGLPLGLGGSQDWFMMDSLINNNTNNMNNNNNNLLNSCGWNEFSFNLHQKLQQHQLQFQQHQQQQEQQQQLMFHLQNLQRDYPCTATTTTTMAATTSGDSHMPMSFSHTLSSQIEKQRQEIDRYISLQNERLKMALEQQRRQQLSLILKKVEEKAAVLLRQRDEEIAKVKIRTMELEEFTRKMEMENQAWQRVAAEKEAMVVSLSNKLEELKEQACCLTTSIGIEDAESWCNNGDEYHPKYGEGEAEVAETGESSRETGERNKMMCRVCKSRNACILFLPCRHLSSCKSCGDFIDSCPVCQSSKRGSIEALLS